MSEQVFEPLPENTSIQNITSVIDDAGGILRFSSDQLASFNFDGDIPKIIETLPASEMQAGMKFILEETDGIYYQIINIFTDDPTLVDSPSNIYVISYKDGSGNTQEISVDGNVEFTVQYEEWGQKYLGTTGWLITSEGNAIFSNIAARGRIEAQEGYLEDLDINGTLNINSGGSIDIGGAITIDDTGIFSSDGNFSLDTLGNLFLTGTIEGATISGDVLFEDSNGLGNLGRIATNPDVEIDGGIYMDDTGLYAYNSSGQPTFSIDSETGDVIIGYLDDELTNIEDLIDNININFSSSISGLYLDLNTISASIDYLMTASYVSESDLITNGGTKISGNNITTGTIAANRLDISSGLTGNRGVKITSLGLQAYNAGGGTTFSINSETGNVTINGGTLTITSNSNIDGYSTDAELNSASSLLNSSIITASSTLNKNIISASSTLNSNIISASSVLNRNLNTASNTLINNIITASTVLTQITGTKIVIGGAAADVNSNLTTINGGKIRTGSIESYHYLYDGQNGNFSNYGMQINLDVYGLIRAPNFYINGQDGTAVFKGYVAAETGYFGTAAQPISIGSISNGTALQLGTLQIGAVNNFGTMYGALQFKDISNNLVGQLSSTNSNQTWKIELNYWDGLVLGTNDQYLYVPASWISTTGKYRGRGFNFCNLNNQSAFLISTPGSPNPDRVYSSAIRDNIYSSGGQQVRIDGSSGMLGRFTGDSSKIYKHDINTITDASPIYKLNPVTFKYNEDFLSSNDQRYLKDIPGFIAEELYEVLPIIVNLENKKPAGWEERMIIPYLVKAIQDQKNTIDNLEKRLLQLESNIKG